MTADNARDAIKQRMSVPSGTTTFDTLIAGFVTSAVSRLFPRAALEVASQEKTGISVDEFGEAEVDLSTLTTPINRAREVEAWDGYTWAKITNTFHHGGQLRLRGLTTDMSKVRLYGLNPFPAMDNVPDWLTQSVVWYGMAEFYDYLAGNKRQYNIYMQVSGARAVDNMADQSAYYDSKADRYLDEQNQAYGG